MSQTFPVNGFELVKKLSKFGEFFLKDYGENSDKGYVEYPKNLLSLYGDLPFLPERNKSKKCIKLVCNICDKENYVLYIRALKQALNHGIILKKNTHSNRI